MIAWLPLPGAEHLLDLSTTYIFAYELSVCLSVCLRVSQTLLSDFHYTFVYFVPVSTFSQEVSSSDLSASQVLAMATAVSESDNVVTASLSNRGSNSDQSARPEGLSAEEEQENVTHIEVCLQSFLSETITHPGQ